MFKLAVICGGPSPERGISLNSARSVMDHLTSHYDIEVVPIYVSYDKHFYAISCAQLYSNTPADFDFKLAQMATKLDEETLKTLLKGVDLTFPVIHGPFGEDGELQELLETFEVPYVGSGAASCKQFFNKYNAAQILKKNGFNTLPSLYLDKQLGVKEADIQVFFKNQQLKKAILKPVTGGSSLGVCSITSPQEAVQECYHLFEQGVFNEVMIEPFCSGKEFTVLVIESKNGEPIALIPTEIEMNEENQIFDYRKKYLPTNQVTYHTPPRFSEDVVHAIRSQAQEIYSLFQMRDFVRLDGWVMPDNRLYFTDYNPISGLEQNSFLFRQASIIGMNHQNILHHVVELACQRNKISFPQARLSYDQPKETVFVLFGGDNAERQVSLMSGTNVWLKLQRSHSLIPLPFLYGIDGNVWQLPYSYALNHTVEEIYQNCLIAGNYSESIFNTIAFIQEKLEVKQRCFQMPQKMSLPAFIARAKKEGVFVFIAMHGGIGEDGRLQSLLEDHQISYNGSNPAVSSLCMDKYRTGEKINQLNDPDLISLPKITINYETVKNFTQKDCEKLWQTMKTDLETDFLLVKPRNDGCSAGIALFHTAKDVEKYIAFIRQKASSIPAGTFPNQKGIIEMPSMLEVLPDFIIEPYIETDSIAIELNSLKLTPKKGWIELTVGVLENNGVYTSLNPSITIAEGAVLSLEEKFQGGTGVNLTPPPESIVSAKATQKIKRLIEKAAQALGISNYCRIDIFFNRISEKVVLIEANSLPGLTPSTVIYHQGLAENPPLTPTALLERIVTSKKFSSEAVMVLV